MKRMMACSLLVLTLAGCGLPVAQAPPATQLPPTDTASPTVTPSPLPTSTPSPTATLTATVTLTATITQTPTITPTATVSPTPTRDFPDAVVLEQANCRYGPGTAYLYSHGLYAGDEVEIHGKNWNGTWYWIQPQNLDRHCWASEIVFEVSGDLTRVPVVTTRLPHTTFAGPPGNVQAVRDGNQVTVSWANVPLSDDKRRGYMIEATVCQNGFLNYIVVRSDSESYTFTDDTNCSSPSAGLLYTAEKHGYSDPVQIPWP
jgi:hypothetical protein